MSTTIAQLPVPCLHHGLGFLLAKLPHSIWPSEAFRGNSGHFCRKQGRFQGGRRNFDDKFVADMKLGNNHEALSHKCPPFQEVFCVNFQQYQMYFQKQQLFISPGFLAHGKGSHAR